MREAGTHWSKSRVALYGVWLASALVVTVGVGLAFLDKRLTGGQIASAIGLNLIASVLFALLFSFISGRVQERLLLERIEATIGGVSQELLGKLAGFEDSYMPTRTYDAGDQWDTAYNSDVTASLNKTVAYAFRGTSAKYVPSRLCKAPRGRLQYVRIIILDPRSQETMQARAAIRKDQTRSGMEVRDIAGEIKDEILMSVVALFECRAFCSPEIHFVRDVAATRSELFDDAVYISWYQGPESARRQFPESLKFSQGTFFYQVQAQELHQRHLLAGYKMKIDQNTNEADIISHLSELAERQVTPDDLRGWSAKYAQYVEEFEKFLDQIQGHSHRHLDGAT